SAHNYGRPVSTTGGANQVDGFTVTHCRYLLGTTTPTDDGTASLLNAPDAASIWSLNLPRGKLLCSSMNSFTHGPATILTLPAATWTAYGSARSSLSPVGRSAYALYPARFLTVDSADSLPPLPG